MRIYLVLKQNLRTLNVSVHASSYLNKFNMRSVHVYFSQINM